MFEQATSVGTSETVSALSELLNSQPITARQAADIAEEKGVDLRYGTLAGYWAGRHGKPSPDTLEKLAKVLPSVSLERLQEVAWKSRAPLGRYTPPKEAVHLNERQRRAVDAIILSMIQPGDEEVDRDKQEDETL